MSKAVTYLNVFPGEEPPTIVHAPTCMVVLSTAEVSPLWLAKVSKWIVESGTSYMMALGFQASEWDDAVDWANIDRYA